jgi:hypothetical protein
MEPRGRERHRWANRTVEMGGAHESMRAVSEFQWPASGNRRKVFPSAALTI